VSAPYVAMTVDVMKAFGCAATFDHTTGVLDVPAGGYHATQFVVEADASAASYFMAIAAITGRPAAEATPEMVERTGTLVGRAVASVANLLDLQLAVVGGSVALGFGAEFFAAAQRELAARAQLGFSTSAIVVPAGLGADGPLIGAAAVAWRA